MTPPARAYLSPAPDAPTIADLVGLRVRSARRLAEVSQKALNRNAGLTQGHLSRIERGVRSKPRRVTIDCLVEALRKYGLEISSDWLLKGVGPKPKRTAAFRRRFGRNPENVL